MKAIKMQHADNPATALLKAVGDISDVVVYGNQVLLAVYERPEKTQSGIILTQTTRAEDQHQGKAGLVLKKGPGAFVSDANYDFRGQNVEPGDWVSIFVSDGRKVMLNGQLCRMVEDHHIRLKIPSPDVVY